MPGLLSHDSNAMPPEFTAEKPAPFLHSPDSSRFIGETDKFDLKEQTAVCYIILLSIHVIFW